MKSYRDVSMTNDAVRAASAYFNALPRADRETLAPLLEHYRLLGVAEYADQVEGVRLSMRERMRGIVDRHDVLAPATTGERS